MTPDVLMEYLATISISIVAVIITHKDTLFRDPYSVIYLLLFGMYITIVRYKHVLEDDACKLFIKDAIYPFKEMLNCNKEEYITSVVSKENCKMDTFVNGVIATKYRQSALEYFKYNKNLSNFNTNIVTISRDKLLVDYVTIPYLNQVYEIEDCDFVACVFGDGRTSLYDLYLDSLQYVADEIRQDCSVYLNNHIQFLKKKRENDERFILESMKKYHVLPDIRIVADDNLTNRTLEKGTPLFVLTDSGMKSTVADGIHTEKYLVNKYINKISTKRKCRLRFPKRINKD